MYSIGSYLNTREVPQGLMIYKKVDLRIIFDGLREELYFHIIQLDEKLGDALPVKMVYVHIIYIHIIQHCIQEGGYSNV